MGAAERRQKDQHMAEMLRRNGIFHGMRKCKPSANSGGLTFKLTDTGSAAYRRLRRVR